MVRSICGCHCTRAECRAGAAEGRPASAAGATARARDVTKISQALFCFKPYRLPKLYRLTVSYLYVQNQMDWFRMSPAPVRPCRLATRCLQSDRSAGAPAGAVARERSRAGAQLRTSHIRILPNPCLQTAPLEQHLLILTQ